MLTAEQIYTHNKKPMQDFQRKLDFSTTYRVNEYCSDLARSA